jgi:Uma2 family endonuclease
MRKTALTDLFDERTILMAHTVDEYHEMLARGIVPEGEPYELLDGHIIRKDRSKVGEDPMSVGTEHTWVINELDKLNAKFMRQRCHIRMQQPITLPKFDEPEPDGTIVRGVNDDYRDRHPGPDDVLCVIEVADSSLRRDRTTKLRIYADSGLPHYIIINLPDRMIEVYTGPLVGKGRYAQSTTLKARQRLELPTGSGKVLGVSTGQLLP